MSAQNKAAGAGGNTRKNKKKRKGRSQQKGEQEQKHSATVDCGGKASGTCIDCDDSQRDEVQIEKVMQPVTGHLSSRTGALTRSVIAAGPTRLEPMPSLDGEHCLLCHRPRDVTSPTIRTADESPLSLWLCPECRMSIEIRQQKKETAGTSEESVTTVSGVTENRDVVMPDVLTVSNGLHREIETLMPRDKDATVMQSKWMELRHAIRCAYRQAGTSLADDRGGGGLGSPVDKLQESVKLFCNRDPHQLYERVEIQAREYILEVKLRLTEQLSLGTSTSQSGRDFLRMLTDEYWSLSLAMETLVDILSPLESEYLQNAGITVELLNKRLFYDLVFTDVAINDAMRAVVQTMRGRRDRDSGPSDTSDPMLLERFTRFEDEMYRADRAWRNVKSSFARDRVRDRTIQRLAEKELRRDEELDIRIRSTSPSKDLSLIERRRSSRSIERERREDYMSLTFPDFQSEKKMMGRDILDPDCPGSPPSFEEHFTFMWDLYLERERYQKDQSPEFRLAERVALDPDDSNPIVKLSLTTQLNNLSRIQRRELADDVLRQVMSRKTTLLEDTSKPRSVASDAFVYTGPVRQFVGCVDASECRCPSCAQTRCKCERCKEARKSIEYVPSTSLANRNKSGKSTKSSRKKGKGGGAGVGQSVTSTSISKGGCTPEGLSMNGVGRFWDVKNRDSALTVDSKPRPACQCPACQMARESKEKRQRFLESPLSETMNRSSLLAHESLPSSGSVSSELMSYTPPISPPVAAPPSSPHPSYSDQSSESQSGNVRSSSPLPPLESQSDETSSVSSLGFDHSYGNSVCETKGLESSVGLSSSSSGTRSGGKHCNCYYCELFGHGQGITAPTSHNFTQVRDKLRLRLNQRKPTGTDLHGQEEEEEEELDRDDGRTVEELVSFITGDDKEGNKRQAKMDKKARQKQKKTEAKTKRSASTKKKQSDNLNSQQGSQQLGSKTIWDNATAALVNHVNSSGPVNSNSWAGLDRVLNHSVSSESDNSCMPSRRTKLSNGSVVKARNEDSRRSHSTRNVADEDMSGNGFGIELCSDEDSDEFDKELEEFRRFCFDSAQQPKKKLSVNLDSLSLKKSSQKQ